MAAPDSTTSRSGLGAGFNPGAILAFVCMGQFMVFTYLFIRLLPIMSIFEIRLLLPESKVKEHH